MKMGLIEINLGSPGGKTRRSRSNGRPLDLRLFTKAGAVLSGLGAVLVIVLGFLASLLAPNPGYSLLGACMICLPIAIAMGVFAGVLWKL
jgi:hypothetical protein